MHKHVLGLATAGILAFSQGAIASCGDVKMANWNWASGEFMANVDKIIMEAGYGCSVELVPGATTTTFASMNEKGQPDIAGEQWTNNIAAPLNEAIAAGRLVSVNDGPITGLGEGWFVPSFFAEKHPELKTAMDILERPDLFPHPEDPSKGAFYGCPAGWGCQLVNANLYRAFNMEEKGWILVDPGSAAGLDGSISKNVGRDQNWFGYYWSPTAMVGKYNLHLLEWGIEWGGSDNWDNCISKPEQECHDPQPTSYTKSVVNTIVTSEFAKSNTEVSEYLSKRVFPGPVMNGILVYMADNQADGEDAAYEFFLNHEDVWTQWVSADIAAKVKASLN